MGIPQVLRSFELCHQFTDYKRVFMLSSRIITKQMRLGNSLISVAHFTNMN